MIYIYTWCILITGGQSLSKIFKDGFKHIQKLIQRSVSISCIAGCSVTPQFYGPSGFTFRPHHPGWTAQLYAVYKSAQLGMAYPANRPLAAWLASWNLGRLTPQNKKKNMKKASNLWNGFRSKIIPNRLSITFHLNIHLNIQEYPDIHHPIREVRRRAEGGTCEFSDDLGSQECLGLQSFPTCLGEWSLADFWIMTWGGSMGGSSVISSYWNI